MLLANEWKDYELIDVSSGQKLERWGKVCLLRPDPMVVWDNGDLLEKYHGKIDAVYYRNNKGGGHWDNLRNVPSSWKINYKNLTFNIKQMGFKHTGLFPEQAANWDFMIDKIKNSNRPIKVLNLFAYTGGASVACLSAGASVVHVDSSRGMVDWAKENVKSSHLDDKPIRYLVDDVVKFVKREIRRGNKYDIILMDPPSFGRGAKNEVWTLEKELFNLVKLCNELLSSDPLLFIINSYTTGLSKTVLEDILRLTVMKDKKGFLDSDELGIKEKESELILPCGIYARFSKYHLD